MRELLVDCITSLDVEAKATGALATGWSDLDAAAEVHDTVAEPALLQQLHLDAGVAGECGLAFTYEHRVDEELAPNDQPAVERVPGEGRPADVHVASRGRLHDEGEDSSVDAVLSKPPRTSSM